MIKVIREFFGLSATGSALQDKFNNLIGNKLSLDELVKSITKMMTDNNISVLDIERPTNKKVIIVTNTNDGLDELADMINNSKAKDAINASVDNKSLILTVS